MSTEGSTENETGVHPDLAKEIILSDGKIAKIFKGKGKHAQKAMRAVGDSKDNTLYLASLMSQLITIDEKELVPEEFGDLPMKDYNELMSQFVEINF